MKSTRYPIVAALICLLVMSATAQQRTEFESLGPFGGAPGALHVFDDGYIAAYQHFSPNHFESLDNGRTWAPAKVSLPDISSTASFIQLANGSVFAAGEGLDNIHFSGDGGRTWLDYPSHRGLAELLVGISLARASEEELYLGGGTFGVDEAELFVSHLGSNWRSVSRIPGMSIPISIVADGEGVVVVEGRSVAGARLVMYSADFGDTWRQMPGDDLFPLRMHVMNDGSVLMVDLTRGVARVELDRQELTFVHPSTFVGAILTLDDGSTLMTADSTLVLSTDSGASWTEIARFETNLVDLDVAPNGDLLATSLDGVHRSSDGGHTWTPSATGIGFLGASGLGRSATGELLVGTDDALLGSFGFGYQPHVVFETDESDGEVQFIETRASGDYLLTVDGDLFVRPAGAAVFEKRRTEERRIWGFDVSRDGQILAISGTQELQVSTDGGNTWTNTWDAIPTAEFNGWDVAVGPAGTLLVTTDEGLFRSNDLGVTWENIHDVPTRTVFALEGGEILVGDGLGVWTSSDDGVSFMTVDYAGVLENVREMPDGGLFSAECGGLFRSDDRGRSWEVHAIWGGLCPTGFQLDADGTIWVTTWDTGLYRSMNPVMVSDERDPVVPTDQFGLGVYPNPLRGTSQLTVSVPSSGRARVELFDMLGRRITVAIDQHVAAGEHTLPARFGMLPAGAYVVRLSLDGRPVATQSVVRTR